MTKIKKFLRKAVPLWLVLILLGDNLILFGVLEYYWLKRGFDKHLVEMEAQNPENLVKRIKQEVLPASGYETSLVWGEVGKKLVETGAIDKQKFEEIFVSPADGSLEMSILEGASDKKIAINENNSRFLVNTLWALGLVNKSKILEQGPMKTGETPTGNFASTGGWTLGAKPAMELYSSEAIIPLTDEQEELVAEIARSVYRPCCGNSTAFPDCNHGMAALGYIELAVWSGLSREQIYKDLLAMNSYWFPTTYVEMAVYFEREKEVSWKDVDPRLALSSEYSSAQGAQKIRQAVQNVPGLKSQGGSCGV